jgi:hypothetical protein
MPGPAHVPTDEADVSAALREFISSCAAASEVDATYTWKITAPPIGNI